MMTESAAASIGERLRQGRLKQRLSISECARQTHVAAHYLEALEDERWKDLPSASHRIGFLKIYSRFLGVPADEILELYYQGVARTPKAEPVPSSSSERSAFKPQPGWYPTSWQQVVVFAFVFLALAWALYHTFHNTSSEARPLTSLAHLRPHQPRLITPQSTTAVQRVRIQAQSDSWVRVVERGHLLYEGILRSGVVKSWSGPGPFDLKMGNVHAVALYWNDQLVDTQGSAHGNINELQLPLPK